MKKLKQLIGTVAPTLASALGGPLAGQAVSAIADMLGIAPNEQDIEKHLATASPEVLVQLKELDFTFKTRMQELNIDLAEIEYKDRDSARKYNTESDSWVPAVLSLVYTIGYFILIGGLMTDLFVMPESSDSLLSGLVGVASAAQIKILDYYFGSSLGSKIKTKMNGHS